MISEKCVLFITDLIIRQLPFHPNTQIEDLYNLGKPEKPRNMYLCILF